MKKITKLLMPLLLLVMSVGHVETAWANTTYYSKLTVAANNTGAGSVYVNTSNSKGSDTSKTQNSSSFSSSVTHTYYIFADSKPGYYFASWAGSNATVNSTSTANTTATVSTNSTSSPEITATCTATFSAVGIKSVDAPSLTPISITNASGIYEGTVVFNTANADAADDYKVEVANQSGAGTYSAEITGYANNQVTVKYTFTGDGTWGGISRTSSAQIKLSSAGGENWLSSDAIPANYPNVAITNGEDEKAYATFKSSDASQDAVEAKVIFDVDYADGSNNFSSATISGEDASHFAIVSQSYADGKVTVTYAYNGNLQAGVHTATLTLSAVAGAGGASKVVTITGNNEVEKDYDVEVFDKDGVSIFTGAWKDGITKVNANDGSTIQLARNVDLGTLSATAASITVNATLDLAGKVVSATYDATSRYMIYMNKAGKTLTITDSKNGGKITSSGSVNGAFYCVGVNAGSMVMDGGTISAENTLVYNTPNASGSAQTSMQTRAVQVAANANFTLKGGEVISEGGNNVYGIRKEGSTTATGEVFIHGGTVNANCKRQYAYGISTLAKTTVDGGTINAKTYTSTGTSEAYGIDVAASANTDNTKEYNGQLIMSGGTINAQSQTSGAYAVRINGSVTCGKDASSVYQPELRRAYPAFAEISGGTFNAISGTSDAYGLHVMNSQESHGNDFTDVVKPTVVTGGTFNATALTKGGAYGITAHAESSWGYATLRHGVVEISNATCNARAVAYSSAYGAYVFSSSKDWVNGHTSTNYHSTYKIEGEYTVAGKMTIHSGTFTGIAETTSAGGVATSTRAIAPSGDYDNVAYPELTINGGTFIGKTEGASATTTAYGLFSGGYTTVNGGEFTALPKTTTAYGVMVNSGKLTISNAKLTATATNTAYGVYVNASVADVTGVKTYAEAELNNLNVTVTTTTGNEADGVRVIGAARTVATSTAWNNHPGEYACSSQATVNGGVYKVTSAGTTAYGLRADGPSITGAGNQIGMPELSAKNATVSAEAKGGKNCYGVYAGGPVALEKCDITAKASAEYSYGVLAYNNATIADCNISSTATTGAYGINANIINNFNTNDKQFAANVVVDGGTITATTTTGNTARALFVERTTHTLTQAEYDKIVHTTYPYPYVGEVTGIAASAEVNGGTFSVNCAGTGGHAVFVNAILAAGGSTFSPKCVINGGKFKGKEADINPDGTVGDFVINGGYFVQKTNVDKYKAANVVIWDLTDGEEYTWGCRYAVAEDRPLGVSVCKIGSLYFYSLENALTYAQQNSGSNHTIVMISDYVLPKGNYTLPSNATLLIPYKADQTNIESHPTRKYNEYNKPTCFRNLTFAEGVHLDVYGTVQTGSLQSAKGQLPGNNGMPTGNYGMITMSKNSKMTIEANAQLYAWGYIVGEGEIDVRRDATVHEFIGVRDWRGGTCTSNMNNNSQKVFPLNQYYIQNIEAATTYRPGSKLLCDGTVNASSNYRSFNDTKLIGVHGSESFFMMDNEDVSEDTWVRKKYDAETDQQVYEINSSAQLGNLILTLSTGWISYTFNSKDYVLPVTNNMKIHVLTGEMQITQNTELLPGAVLEVDKEASFVLNSGKNLYVLDIDEWGTYEQKLEFSPSWKTGTCPRAAMTDAHVNVHGTFNVSGGVYTSAGGAGIFSTNSDAGTIQFNVAAPTADATIYRNNTTVASSMTAMTIKPAWLKNGDGNYAKTISTAAGNSYCYSNNQWRCWVTDGCFAIDKTDNSNWIYYAKPGDYVALSSNAEDANHLYHSQDLSRHFILMEGCQWWDVKQTEEDDDVYYCADNDTYYYYTGSAWAEKTVTVTWQNYDASTIATYSNVRFGSKPKYLGTNPKRAMDNYYTYDFIGWLPEITDDTKVYENTTYIANYEQNDRLFQITFKDGSTTIETDFYGWGTMPVCEKAPKKAGYILSWSPALGAVSGAQTYTAVWTAETVDPTTLKYTVTWKNYEGTTLQTDENVTYGVTPSYSGTTPTKPSLSDVDYVFAGWTPDVVPVTGNAVYTAAYNTAARKYTVTFKNQDGTVIETQSLGYGEVPACQNPPTQASTAEFYYVAKWDKQITAVTGDVVYTHAGFTAYKNTCRLTVAAGANGSVLLAGASDPLTNIYDYGTEVVISATGNEHYHFSKWSDGNTENPRTVTVNQTLSLTAQFPLDQVTVSWLNYDGVAITTTQVDYGTKPTYTGTTPNRPNGCGTFYTFSAWSPNPSAAVVTAPTSFTAQYDEHISSTLKSYKVSFAGNGANEGTMADQNFAYGTP